MTGWTGKLLRVDLTAGTTKVEPIPREWLEEYIGGRGLGDRYLVEEVDPKVDPLAPENKMIFATGPLTGTPVPCGARYMVITKGALTGAITTSNSGWPLGSRTEIRRLRSAHPRRQIAQAGLSVHSRRQGRTA